MSLTGKLQQPLPDSRQGCLPPATSCPSPCTFTAQSLGNVFLSQNEQFFQGCPLLSTYKLHGLSRKDRCWRRERLFAKEVLWCGKFTVRDLVFPLPQQTERNWLYHSVLDVHYLLDLFPRNIFLWVWGVYMIMQTCAYGCVHRGVKITGWHWVSTQLLSTFSQISPSLQN